MSLEEELNSKANEETSSFVDSTFGGPVEDQTDHSREETANRLDNPAAVRDDGKDPIPEDNGNALSDDSIGAGENLQEPERKNPENPEKQEPDETSRLKQEVENLRKRLKDTQSAMHKATGERAALEKELAELRAKEDDDDWFGEDDKKRVRELEDGLKKSDEQIRKLNESLAEDARKDAEAVWDEAAAEVKAQHPDFDDVVYEKFAPLLHEKTGNAQIRAAWEGEKDKSPANAYRFAKKVLEIIEFQRDPDAYKARLRREIETEKRKTETESVSEPTGKDGLDMLNSADIPIDPGRSVSFVDAVFK